MRKTLLLFLITLAFFSTGMGRRHQAILVTFHLQVSQEEAQMRKNVMQINNPNNPGRPYFFRKVPEISNNNIRWYYPFMSKKNASYGAVFGLDGFGTSRLQNFTYANQGSNVLAALNGSPVHIMHIDGVIQDGKIVLWEGLSTEHLELLDKSFKRYGEGAR